MRVSKWFVALLFIGPFFAFAAPLSGKAAPAASPIPIATKKTAVFAGGCFWCMQPPFDKLKNEGVIAVRVGYAGGTKVNPTYEETSSGATGHRESVEVTYDPRKITYAKLLDVFWHNIDPFNKDGQFCDSGEQYTGAVFYNDEAEKIAFEKSRDEVKKTAVGSGEFATVARPYTNFYAAEGYHQSYYEKNPIRYNYYRHRCGRDDRLKAVWGAKSGGH